MSRRILNPAEAGVHLCFESNAWSCRFQVPSEDDAEDDANIYAAITTVLCASMTLWLPDAIAVSRRNADEFGFEGEPIRTIFERAAFQCGLWGSDLIVAWAREISASRDDRCIALIESLGGGWLRVALPDVVEVPSQFDLRNSDGMRGSAETDPADVVENVQTVWIRLNQPESGFMLAMDTPNFGEITLRSTLTLFNPKSDVRSADTIVLGTPLTKWFEANAVLIEAIKASLLSAFE